MQRNIAAALAVALLLIASFGIVPFAAASPIVIPDHRDGCHRWHSCPSDSGSYVCGDMGYYDYCPENAPKPLAPKPIVQPQPVEQPIAIPVNLPSTRPSVNWQTYETDALFRNYWDKRGGITIFGLAKTSVYSEKGIPTQIFERNRIEFHPENKAPYNYQLGLLGEERLVQLGRIWQNEARSEAQPNCRYFAETGHNVCEPFLSYWRNHGIEIDGKRGFSEAENLALFGYPVTDNENGTQWFQRARFEDHGAEGVLLGLLGNEVYGQP